MDKFTRVKDAMVNFFKTKKKIVLIILLIIVIAIILVMVVPQFFKKDEVGNTSGNLSNYGITTYSDGWIYYLALEDGTPTGIYKTRSSGGKSEKVSIGTYIYINVINDTIYCLEYDEDSSVYNIVKLSTDGKNKDIILKNVDRGPITVAGKDIYYFKNDVFYRMNLDGEQQLQISDRDISYYQVYGNKIYFIYKSDEGSYIARMKRNGEDVTRIGRLQDKEYVALQVKGGNVYYVTLERTEDYLYKYELYSMNKKGEEIAKIVDLPEDTDFINMQEDALYYAFDTSGYDIRKINYKSKKDESIAQPKELASISIAGKWLFYITQDDNYKAVIERITTTGDKQETL